MLIVEVSGDSAATSFLQVPEGQVIAWEGYGAIAFEVERNGTIFQLPWIPITVRNLVVPIAGTLQGKFRIVESMNPGYTVRIRQRSTNQLTDL